MSTKRSRRNINSGAEARTEEKRRKGALAAERFAAEAEAARRTATLRAAAASTISFGFLNSVAGGRTLSVIELVGEPDLPPNSLEIENVAEGGPVRRNSVASNIYNKNFPYETIKDLIRVAPALREAAEETERELLKRNFDSISWIVAYQARPQAPSDQVNYTGNTPLTHASILILLPDGRLYTLGIGVTDKTRRGGVTHLYSPDALTFNLRPHPHVAFPFTTFFYEGIQMFLNRNAASVAKMYYMPRTVYNVAGIPHSATSSTQFFDVTLKRSFLLSGTYIPYLYDSLNCARGVQELLRNTITVGTLVAHPDEMIYRYGPFEGDPLPPDWSEFIYQLLFGNKRGEKDLCSKYAPFCKYMMESMPPPSHKGGHRTRRQRRPKKN